MQWFLDFGISVSISNFWRIILEKQKHVKNRVKRLKWNFQMETENGAQLLKTLQPHHANLEKSKYP